MVLGPSSQHSWGEEGTREKRRSLAESFWGRDGRGMADGGLGMMRRGRATEYRGDGPRVAQSRDSSRASINLTHLTQGSGDEERKTEGDGKIYDMSGFTEEEEEGDDEVPEFVVKK